MTRLPLITCGTRLTILNVFIPNDSPKSSIVPFSCSSTVTALWSPSSVKLQLKHISPSFYPLHVVLVCTLCTIEWRTPSHFYLLWGSGKTSGIFLLPTALIHSPYRWQLKQNYFAFSCSLWARSSKLHTKTESVCSVYERIKFLSSTLSSRSLENSPRSRSSLLRSLCHQKYLRFYPSTPTRSVLLFHHLLPNGDVLVCTMIYKLVPSQLKIPGHPILCCSCISIKISCIVVARFLVDAGNYFLYCS